MVGSTPIFQGAGPVFPGSRPIPRVVLSFFLFFFLAGPLLSLDRLHLIQGDQVSGRVLLVERDLVLMETIHGNYRIPRGLVQSIELDDAIRRITMGDGTELPGRFLSTEGDLFQFESQGGVRSLSLEEIEKIVLIVQ